ncbi:MAG: class I tRNA ligase family protein, partial [Firmicutes bacterium]|nr:class I tRNA ligase family protein [Bacillota bacterium]
EEDPTSCPDCGSTELVQESDVLDTWFSSALWPFSTMGWPNETEDLKYFYPTDVLVTGYDIIFFWVVRMVFSALECTGEVPFKHVYVHGLVRDAEGRKMSKSLGNGIDPLDMIDQYGTDALRFMLATGIAPGSDIRFKQDRLESCRNFANKLWNASRFVIMNLQDENGDFLPMAEGELSQLALKDEDKWILSLINEVAKDATTNLDNFDLALAGQKIQELIWNGFCDWYIELVKSRLYEGEEEDKKVARRVLVSALETLLTLLHPFMPFITEEIWSYLPDRKTMLIQAEWPVYDEAKKYDAEVARVELAMAIIRSIRNIRVEADAAPSKKLRAVILAKNAADVQAEEKHICKMAGISEITFAASKSEVPEEVMSAVVDGAEIYIPLDDLLDYKAEFERLQKEEARLQGEVKRIGGMLSNQAFVSKAPEKVVNTEREKLAKAEEMLGKVKERLEMVAKKL